MEACSRCSYIFLNPPPHAAGACPIAPINAPCHQCGKDINECAFYLEEFGPGVQPCSNLSHLVVAGIALTVSGVKTRHKGPATRCLAGLTTPGVQLTAAQVSALVESLNFDKRQDMWYPGDLGGPNETIYVDRAAVPWKISADERLGAEAVPYRDFLMGVRGQLQQPEAPQQQSTQPPGPQSAPTQLTSPGGQQELEARVSALQAQLSQMTGVLQAVLSAQTQLASQVSVGITPPAPVGAPSNFQFGYNNVGPGGVYNLGGPPVNVQDARMAAAPGLSRVHARLAFQGTNPLSVANMHEDVTQAKRTQIEVVVDGAKVKESFYYALPIRSDRINLADFYKIAANWMDGLREANERVQRLTPTSLRELAPQVPLDVTVFLARLHDSFAAYPPARVFEVWSRVHDVMVQQYLDGAVARSSWEDALRLPIILAAFGVSSTRPTSSTTISGDQYCRNWNFRSGRDCKDAPRETPTKCELRHRCLRCDGEHRLVDCTVGPRE